MRVLKDRSSYLDDKAGGDGITGSIIRFFSKDARKYDAGRRGEDAIADALSRLDDSHFLINDVILPSSHGNIDHVLLTPKNIFVLETKNWSGKIICQGDEWVRQDRKGILFSKKTDMGCPSRQVKRNAINLSKFIESGSFHNTFKIWVEGAIVFTNRNVNLELHEPSVAVLRMEELYNYIIGSKQMLSLSERELKSIGKYVAGMSTR